MTLTTAKGVRVAGRVFIRRLTVRYNGPGRVAHTTDMAWLQRQWPSSPVPWCHVIQGARWLVSSSVCEVMASGLRCSHHCGYDLVMRVVGEGAGQDRYVVHGLPTSGTHLGNGL